MHPALAAMRLNAGRVTRGIAGGTRKTSDLSTIRVTHTQLSFRKLMQLLSAHDFPGAADNPGRSNTN